MRQEYEKYTAEDHRVWQLLYERQMPNLPRVAAAEYLAGIERVGFVADRVPDFADVNRRLAPLTGWQLHVVPGLIPNGEFFELMANCRFPSSTWLRSLSQLDYLEEPDMFHDVFGHVPLLSNPPLCHYLADLSRIALQYLDNLAAIEQIARLYWYTVEFGLIREDGELKIYGAGILSSVGETAYCLGPQPQRVPYRVRDVLDTPYIKEKYQEKYFVIDSYAQLYASVSELAQELSERAIA